MKFYYVKKKMGVCLRGEVGGCFPSRGNSLAIAWVLDRPERREARWRDGQEPWGKG